MRIAGGFSVIAGISYIIASTAHQPRLMVLVIYTATGGVEFVVQAWLLAAARSPPKHTRRPRPERELKRRARRASCRIP